MNILMILSNPLLVDTRVHKEAKALVDAGHRVAVVVWDKQGKYAPEDVVDGIHVIRIRNQRLLNVMPPFLQIPVWWMKAYRAAMELYSGGFRFDAVHCHDLDTLPVGSRVKKQVGCNLVYDAHEIFGYMVKDSHPLISRLAFGLENWLMKQVDHVVTIDAPFKEYYEGFDVPVTVVMNCKDLQYAAYAPPDNEVFTLIYIGLMIENRFFPRILDVVRDIPGVNLRLAGRPQALYEEIKARSRRYDCVDFLGTVPSEDILPLTREADATFVLVDLKGQHRLNVFNKQFEAMVCGRPIIITKGTYAGELTEELRCGVTVDYDEKSIRNAIITLRDDQQLREELGKNAFQAATERYNWGKEKEHLLQVYEGLA